MTFKHLREYLISKQSLVQESEKIRKRTESLVQTECYVYHSNSELSKNLLKLLDKICNNRCYEWKKV